MINISEVLAPPIFSTLKVLETPEESPLKSVGEQLDAIIAKEHPTLQQIKPYAEKAYISRIYGRFVPSTPEPRDWKTGEILFAIDKSLGHK